MINKIVYHSDNLSENKYIKYMYKNNINPFKDKVDSVAIVGNSSCLLDSTYGKKIDKHDKVVRFNLAKTYGYEDNVGSKTDIRLLGKNLLFQEKNEIIIHRFNKPEYLKYNVDNKVFGKNYYAFSKDFMEHCKVVLGKLYTGIPSSGFCGVLIGLLISKEVYLYGFDIDKKYHYFDDIDFRNEKGHNFNNEYKFYEKQKNIIWKK
jgi:hypothetical protein